MTTLTREQRKALFEGGAPSVKGRGKCPWKPGDTYAVSSLMTLTVNRIRVKPAKPTEDSQEPHWSLTYTIYDRRDKVRNLRHVPPVHVEAYEQDQDDREAAIESAYTSASVGLVNDCGEGVSDDSLKSFAQEAGQMNVLYQEARRARWERLTLAERAHELETLAPRSAADVSRELRLAAHALAKAKAKLDRAAA